MIKMKQISKQFGNKVVLDRIDLELKQGRVIGFVGANGSGKTTLMKIMLGLLKADSGQVWVKGEPVTFGETRTNRFIGYLPDVPEFYPYYTAEEFLNLTAGVTEEKVDENWIKAVLESVGLAGNQTKVSNYSRGMKQRLGFAQSMLHDPDILICDEPTSALDPEGRQQILKLIKDNKGSKIVFFSTHILSDIEEIADEVVFLKEGKIKFHKPLQDLRAALKEDYLLEVSQAQATEEILLKNKSAYSQKAKSEFILHDTNEQENLKILKELTSADILIKSFRKLEKSLYDVIKEVSE